MHAIETADEASNLAAELKDVRASRSVTRLKASALRQVHSLLKVQPNPLQRIPQHLAIQFAMVWQCTQVGDLKGALRALEQAMALSEEIGDRSHDADVLGEIADTFADMGDFEQAAQVSVSNYVSCSCQSVHVC